MPTAPKYKVTIRVYHGPLSQAMERAGLSVRALAAKAGMPANEVHTLLNFKRKPVKKKFGKGQWRKVAIAVASALEMDLLDLFPEELMHEGSNTMSAYTDNDLMISGPSQAHTPALLAERAESSDELYQAIATLKPREQHILHRRYYAGAHLDDVAKELNLTRERVRQLQSKALNTLRKRDLTLKLSDIRKNIWNN